MQIVPNNIREELIELGKSVSNSKWRIGDLALSCLESVLNRNGNVPNQEVWHAVGKYCGLSGRRVSKLAAVALAFPEELRDPRWSFGHYEATMPFEAEVRLQMLEFLSFFLEEYGRTLLVSEFVMVFRTHVLGEVVEPELPDDKDYNVFPRFLEYTDRLWNEISAIPGDNASELRRLLRAVRTLLPAVMEEAGLSIREEARQPASSERL